MRFKVGQTVVCIDDKFDTSIIGKWFEQLPKAGKEYKIRSVRPDGAEGGILLVELVNTPKFFQKFGGKLEPAFSPNRFVSIDELDAVFEEEKQKEELIEV